MGKKALCNKRLSKDLYADPGMVSERTENCYPQNPRERMALI